MYAILSDIGVRNLRQLLHVYVKYTYIYGEQNFRKNMVCVYVWVTYMYIYDNSLKPTPEFFIKQYKQYFIWNVINIYLWRKHDQTGLELLSAVEWQVQSVTHFHHIYI